MRIIIEINCENDAFSNDPIGELSRALRTVPSKITAICGREAGCLCDAPEADDKIQDANGNTVGSIQVRK